MEQFKSIGEVIDALEIIIIESQDNEDPLGYFAALYQKVTIKVKQGIDSNFFEDGLRMEKLDVVFAQRYLNAYRSYKNNQHITLSWRKAFELSNNYWPIVLQHLLLGMNAHINLDLGLAAAEISKGKDIAQLENDFNKINEILSSLVNEVQNDLALIWPRLKKILKMTRKVDDFLIDFSMELARDGAWEFAKAAAAQPDGGLEPLIKIRDERVAEQSKIISNPGLVAKIIFGIIRIRERGSISNKIKALRK